MIGRRHKSSNLTRGLFLLEKGEYEYSGLAAPKLALVPASRYKCDFNESYVNVCAKFHED